MPANTAGKFVVCVHDVSPRFTQELATIISRLREMVGTQFSLALVPCWHHRFDLRNNGHFLDLISHSDEYLLHGFSHIQHTRHSIFSWLTRQADEFAGYGYAEAQTRMVQGCEILQTACGRRAAGFVPPAWSMGPVDMKMVQECNLQFITRYFSVDMVNGSSVPINSWSWDSGRFASAGYVSHVWANTLQLFRPESIPVIVIHPIDVARGFFTVAIRLIQRFLTVGRTPCRFDTIISNPPRQAGG